MAVTHHKSGREKKRQREKKPYTPPATIYEGIISTRAGTPFGLAGEGAEQAVDPADLFGNGN